MQSGWELSMPETAASYVRETNTDTNVPYDVKFAK
jgi:hypothetical protein